jgi:hypothetical protein
MGRPGVLLIAVLALGSAGCLRLLFPDFECTDECFPGETNCGGDSTQFCILEPFFGCLVWWDDVNCADRGAVCVDAECVCPEGSYACGPDAVCSDTIWDPQNCGGCGIVCEGACVDGQCVTSGGPGPPAQSR